MGGVWPPPTHYPAHTWRHPHLLVTLALPLMSFVILGGCLASVCLGFSLCEMGMIVTAPA